VEEDLPSGLAVALGAILRAELHLVLGTAQRLVELIALPPCYGTAHVVAHQR
jgi:hypothetical protein